jgi:nucleoside-diphosphate-sugar epimerase
LTYFLTGATGFVGSHVARQLVEAGHTVRAVVRSPGKAADLKALGVVLYEGDVTDKESMRAGMTGVDGVFHIAGWYKVGLRDKRDGVRVNVDGTRHVLELMEELRIPKGVYTSTLAVNSDTRGQVVDETYRFTGRHLTVYDATKAEAHRMAEAFIGGGLPLVIVQPGLIYGPGDTSGVRTTFIEFLKRKLPALPTRTAYAWGYIDDVARGHLLAMAKGQPGRNYFICGPVHTLIEAMNIASEITGIPAPKIHIPPAVLKIGAVLVRPFENILPIPPAYTSEGLKVIAGISYIGSNERAKRELGFTVRPLREGLEITLREEMRQLKT